jgi:arginyl-tRNA synthetase
MKLKIKNLITGAAKSAHQNGDLRILEKTEIAGPGFINFFLKTSAWHPVLQKIHAANTRYGATDVGKGQKFQVEFVSSNPTGPLHVGHGRGAAVGDAVANILAFCGYDVEKEYYINDSGRQIHTLGRSVYLRYKEMFGQKVTFPDECYQGDYIRLKTFGIEFDRWFSEQSLYDSGRVDQILDNFRNQGIIYEKEWGNDLFCIRHCLSSGQV